jgi:hypothetical protein
MSPRAQLATSPERLSLLAALPAAHSETVGAGGQMRVRNRMQVFANRRESNRAWLVHA